MKTFLTSIGISLVVFFAPIAPLLITVGAFIFADTFFGLYASYRLKKPILSRKLFRLATKMLVYQAAVLLFFCIDYLMINELMMLVVSVKFVITKLISLGLIGIELFSIDEKIRSYNDDKGIAYHFKKILKVAKNVKQEYNEIKD